MAEPDEYYMQQCLALAVGGHPSPNPYVGALIVKDGRIIGKGFHRQAGMAHAEVEAIEDVKKNHPDDHAALLAGATLYVNLEPCNHSGRTPPCTRAILEHRVGRVVYAMADPNPHVSGAGAAHLDKHGVSTQGGVLEGQARAVNAAWLKVMQRGLPLVTLKMAMTLDGKTATADGRSKWISGAQSRDIVMKMRDKADAVMVGAGTVRHDDPQLTARGEGLRSPARVVVDSHLSLTGKERIFPDGGAFLACTREAAADAARAQALEKAGARLIPCPADAQGHVELEALLRELANRGFNQVLCEGGSTIATELVARNLADVMILFVAPKAFGAGAKSLFGELGVEDPQHARRFEIVNVMRSGEDLMLVVRL